VNSSSRIILAPFQRLPDDLVLVRASELLQESLASFVVNERSAFRITPSVQLDRKMAVIDGELKRWRIPHFFSDRTHIPFSSRIVKLSVGNALFKVSGRRLRRPTDLNTLAPDFFGTRGGTEKKGCQESTGSRCRGRSWGLSEDRT
jgi:hypothetical protein